MDDLLKDAIADAKAVRETALENAKIALEEAFTPRLQSMLSKKIQSEIEDEDDIEERDDEDEDPEERMDLKAGDEDPSDDHSEEDMDEIEDDEDDEPKMDMESVIEIDGVKYAPVVSEEEDEDHDEEEMEESDDFDLDEILKELEEEEDEDDEMDESKEDEVTEGEHEDDDKEDVDEEVDATTGIGSSDNKKGSADKSSGIGSKDKAKFESVEVTEEKDEDDMDEDIDLEEIVKALSEEEDEEEKKDENSKLQSELEEHRNVVKYLRSKLNEVNLLNAKLLFTNKLFRSHGLSNDQKMKVVETFDRAHNLREVKLVYSTLAESFGSKQTKTEIKESKGSASKPVASTKSEKQEVIAEGHEMRDRFKKLAGIL